MSEPMTPQERAEDVYYGLQVMNVPEYNLRAADNERDVQAIVDLITETRRAALLEAKEEIQRYADKMNTRDSDTFNIKQAHIDNLCTALDRLAQEG